MLKKINFPNKLTLLRNILIPFFVIFMSLPQEWVWPYYTGLVIFIVAAITDFFDGHISRKKNLITKFGKIMDPLADKLLISAGFIMLTGLNVIPGWITAIIVFRDFFVNAFRMFGADKGKDLGAGPSGKLKTIFELISIPLAILGKILFTTNSYFAFVSEVSLPMFELMVNVLMSITVTAAVICTLVSMVIYFFQYKEDINVEE